MRRIISTLRNALGGSIQPMSRETAMKTECPTILAEDTAKEHSITSNAIIPDEITCCSTYPLLVTETVRKEGNMEETSTNIEYSFTGDKSGDLIKSVLETIHQWKEHYHISIPDKLLLDQVLILFNKLHEINSDS